MKREIYFIFGILLLLFLYISSVLAVQDLKFIIEHERDDAGKGYCGNFMYPFKEDDNTISLVWQRGVPNATEGPDKIFHRYYYLNNDTFSNMLNITPNDKYNEIPVLYKLCGNRYFLFWSLGNKNWYAPSKPAMKNATSIEELAYAQDIELEPNSFYGGAVRISGVQFNSTHWLFVYNSDDFLIKGRWFNNETCSWVGGSFTIYNGETSRPYDPYIIKGYDNKLYIYFSYLFTDYRAYVLESSNGITWDGPYQVTGPNCKYPTAYKMNNTYFLFCDGDTNKSIRIYRSISPTSGFVDFQILKQEKETIGYTSVAITGLNETHQIIGFKWYDKNDASNSNSVIAITEYNWLTDPPYIDLISPEDSEYYILSNETNKTLDIRFRVFNDNKSIFEVKLFIDDSLVYSNSSYYNGTDVIYTYTFNIGEHKISIFANDTDYYKERISWNNKFIKIIVVNNSLEILYHKFKKQYLTFFFFFKLNPFL